MRMNERKDKKMLSEARVSKWPNTIHAERERKEYERIKKLENDEVSKPDQVSKFQIFVWGNFLSVIFFIDREKENRR